MAVRRRDEDLLQILNDLIFSSLADLANLAVEEGRPHLVTALLADLAPEWHIMVNRGIIQTFDVYLVELSDLVLAELSILEVLLNAIRANNAGAFASIGILDDLGALVADLPELGDAVHKSVLLVAVQLDLVGQALLKIMAAEGGVLIEHLCWHSNKSKNGNSICKS